MSVTAKPSTSSSRSSESAELAETSRTRVVFVSYHSFSAQVFRPEIFHQFFLARKNKFASYRRISGNWDHISKTRIDAHDENTQLIDVPEYRKNVSLARIKSHVHFAFRVIFNKHVRQADWVVVSAPPVLGAFAASVARLFKRRTRTLVDIVDIWPEAWPFQGIKKRLFDFFVGAPWVLMRTLYLHDVEVLCHAPFFKKHLRAPNVVDLPLCRLSDEMRLDSDEEKLAEEKLDGEPNGVAQEQARSDEVAIRICVLGSINHVLDIESLLQIVFKLSQQGTAVVLEIIGAGERKDQLLEGLAKIGERLQVIDHGASFDVNLKSEVLTRSDFGYNGYRSETAVGVTYKSIEFLSFGCLLLNSLQGDLTELVESDGIGLNFKAESIEALVRKMLRLSDEDRIQMSRNALTLSDRLFSRAAFEEKLEKVLWGEKSAP